MSAPHHLCPVAEQTAPRPETFRRPRGAGYRSRRPRGVGLRKPPVPRHSRDITPSLRLGSSAESVAPTTCLQRVFFVSHFPQYKDMPVGQMIETIITTPIAEVEKAIKSRDRAKFVSTFDKLTDACNTCHQAANRAFIVVQRPAASPFPNQSFAPKRN